MGATPAGPSPPAKLVLTLPRCRGPRAWVSGPTCAPRSLRRCPLARAARTGAAAGSRDPTAPAATLVAHGPLREPRGAPCGRRQESRAGRGPGRRRLRSPPPPHPPAVGFLRGSRQVHGPGAWAAAAPGRWRRLGLAGSLQHEVGSGGQGSAPRWPLDARAKAPVCPAFAVVCARVFPRGRRAGFPRLEPRARWRKHCCCEGYLEGELEVF